MKFGRFYTQWEWVKLGYAREGASTIEYTTPLPRIGLSESDSKLYTNFEFCEGKES